MMFAMGPSPDQELLDSRPDDVSFEVAVGAWHAGYGDARLGRDFHVFPSDSQDIQPFYADGFERGERDKLHMSRITERHGSETPESEPREPESEPRVPESTPGDNLLKAIFPDRNAIHGYLLENSELLTALATASVAVAIFIRGGERWRP